MVNSWVGRAVQVTVVAVTLSAVFQELEKPPEERDWHGKIGFIPYDFRRPTLQRLQASYWNPESPHVFSPEVFGVGWAVNFFALLEKLRIITEQSVAEEDFLMPTRTMRNLLAGRSAEAETVVSPDTI